MAGLSDIASVRRVLEIAVLDAIGLDNSPARSNRDFQGSWNDTATGLYWVVTRWYGPAQGRFISEDSLLGEPTNPDSRHRYAYAEGDPVGSWDPTGQASEERGLIEAMPPVERRRPYRLTGLGATVLESQLQELSAFAALGLRRLAGGTR